MSEFCVVYTSLLQSYCVINNLILLPEKGNSLMFHVVLIESMHVLLSVLSIL